MPHPTTNTFGDLLKQLRKRAGMTQSDLAAALGYSISLVCALEQNRRLPDLEAVIQGYLPALGLQDNAQLATQLVEAAAYARGEKPPNRLTLTRQRRLVLSEEIESEPYHLPQPPTPLLGREAAVKQLCSRILGHSGRLLTLVGPPGVGKTRLGLAAASQLALRFKDGVRFVSLAAVADPELVATTIANQLDLADSGQLSPPMRLIQGLRQKTLLLLLDNFEQIIAAAPLLAALLAACPGVYLLVTSRERLHLRAEQRYPVPPLDLDFAIALFVQRAQAVEPAFAPTAATLAIIAQICQRLDCLPLAIELIAARIDLFSPTQLLAELQSHPLDLLVDGAQDIPAQQRTLRSAIRSSYQLLDPNERRLFRSLGIFVGGFDLTAVATLNDGREEPLTRSLLAMLHTLTHKNLVRSETAFAGEPRFFLLETIREFALEQMRAEGEEAQLRHRHYATYLQLFRTGDSYLRGAEAAIWFARLAAEQGNLRAALQWAFHEARYTDAAWLLVGVHYFWHFHGHVHEESKWIEQLLPHRQLLATDLHLAILLSFYAPSSIMEEFQPIDCWIGEVMQLTEDCSNKLLHAAAWHWIALIDVSPIAAMERSIALVRAAGESPGLGTEFTVFADRDFALAAHLWTYADHLINQGELDRATPIVSESLELFQKRGNYYGIGDSFGNLGRLALLQGHLMQAHTLFHEVVTIATTFSYRMMLCEWQPLLGIVILYEGNTLEARRMLSESLCVCLDLKNKPFLGRVCAYLAEIALCEGELSQAKQWLVQSLGYHADPRRVTIHEIGRLWVAARLATAQQEYGRAATLFGLAEQMHSQIHHVIDGPIRDLADAALATVRAALEPALFAEAFAAGQQMPLAEAFATLLTANHKR